MSPRTSLAGSSAYGVEQANLPTGVVGAVALHAAILAVAFFALAHTLDISDQSLAVVPVDLITIGDKNNVQAMVKTPPKELPKEEEVQPPVPEQTQVAPSPPQQEEAAPPPDEMAVEKVQPKPPPPVVPQQKPQPEKKNDVFDLAKMEAALNKTAPASAAPNARVGNRTIKGIGAQNAMTADLSSALFSQIKPCWSPDPGAPHAEQLSVQFEIFLNRDGTVAQDPQLLTNTGGNSYLRAAAEAARRAIFACQPYHLPADRYSQWQDIQFNFDPRTLAD